MYRLLVYLLVLIHLAFIVFALFGGFLLLCNKYLLILHLPAIVWSVYIVFSGGKCPLTLIENKLRAAAGQAEYRGGFVLHYLLPIIYHGGSTSKIHIYLGMIAICINIFIYALLAYNFF